MFRKGFHPFHMVSQSPWPIFSGFSSMFLIFDYFSWHSGVPGAKFIFFFSVLLLSTTLILWWRDVLREASIEGGHTKKVQSGLKVGFVLFIVSELMFFFSFFFSYFSSALIPDIAIGMKWPPEGVEPVEFDSLPFINTAILLSSGVSLTWAHNLLINSKKGKACFAVGVTIVFAFLFLFLQFIEFLISSFTICDSIYGSMFFTLSGFHGIHVVIGTIFLLVSFFLMLKGSFSPARHLWFEFTAWYWHFVDVIWLFVFAMAYVWGS